MSSVLGWGVDSWAGCQLPILGKSPERLLRFCQLVCYYSFMKKPLVVGFDFDGVVAYNPARLARFPISYFKRNILGIHTVRFFVPKNSIERAFWSLAHESSMFPSYGASHLQRLVAERRIEAHLVTSRFGFLEPNLRRFLNFWGLADTFTSVTLNRKEEQPHEFKERTIRANKFDYYVEDNWDIVSYLAAQQLPTKVHWIYNIFDRNKQYQYKYPYLEKSLAAMMRT